MKEVFEMLCIRHINHRAFQYTSAKTALQLTACIKFSLHSDQCVDIYLLGFEDMIRCASRYETNAIKMLKLIKPPTFSVLHAAVSSYVFMFPFLLFGNSIYWTLILPCNGILKPRCYFCNIMGNPNIYFYNRLNLVISMWSSGDMWVMDVFDILNN